jgi:uncharacterized membrane protein
MLGPLPPLYRLIVALSALAVFVGVGAWVTYTVAGPSVLTSMGASIGAGIGAIVAMLLLHDSSHPGRHLQPRHARSRTQRRL